MLASLAFDRYRFMEVALNNINREAEVFFHEIRHCSTPILCNVRLFVGLFRVPNGDTTSSWQLGLCRKIGISQFLDILT